MKWINLAWNKDQQRVLAKVFCIVFGEFLYIIIGLLFFDSHVST